MIRNDQERATSRKKLAAWRGLQHNIVRMVRDWEIQDPELLLLIDSRVQTLNADLNRYELLRWGQASGSGPDSSDSVDPFRLIQLLPSVGSALIESRLALGWTQSDFARAARLTVQQISKYEKDGYSKITLARAQELAKVLQQEAARRKK
jgi:DNA-binding XRE family transcriptional regulator